MRVIEVVASTASDRTVWVLAESPEAVKKVLGAIPYLTATDLPHGTRVSLSDIDFALPDDTTAFQELMRGFASSQRFQTVTYCTTQEQLVKLLEFCDDHHIDYEQPEAMPVEQGDKNA